MLTQELLSLLWCPTCRRGALHAASGDAAGGDAAGGGVAGDVVPTDGELACAACGSRYPVAGGVPALIPHDATNTEAWALWRKHLDKFQARRDDRVANPERAAARSMKTSRPQEPFARFTRITSGTLLDVGCGPGKFRANFDAGRVRYVGLDPIALPEIGTFPFVRGVAEYLPFRAGAFTDVVVLAALDHFRDTALFFREAARVLGATGRLHILQSVHELRGATSLVKVLGHKVKDAVEDWDTRAHGSEVPKHLSEFTSRSLLHAAAPYFDLAAQEEYNATWYTPTKLFLSLRPKHVAGRAGVAAAWPAPARAAS